MASFDYNLSGTSFYHEGNLLGFRPSVQDPLGSINDGSGDSTFVSGETLYSGVDGGGTPIEVGQFIGSTVVVGVTYLVYGPSPVTDLATYYFVGRAGNPNLAITAFDDVNGVGSSVNIPTPVDEGDFTVCFAGGTLIATPDGERAVETLEIGDMILTADGRTVPVKWIGLDTVHKLFTPRKEFIPVRVLAGALGNGLPHSDLVLTAAHALVINGLAITAGALVNGSSIINEPYADLPERVTYYHIETEAHEVVLANGAAAETFVDYVTRRHFDNYAEYEALFGAETTIDEMPLLRISSPRLVPASIRARLAGLKAA